MKETTMLETSKIRVWKVFCLQQSLNIYLLCSLSRLQPLDSRTYISRFKFWVHKTMKYNLDNLCEEGEDLNLFILNKRPATPRLQGISEYELTQLKQQSYIQHSTIWFPRQHQVVRCGHDQSEHCLSASSQLLRSPLCLSITTFRLFPLASAESGASPSLVSTLPRLFLCYV